MDIQNLTRLAGLVRHERDAVLAVWRRQVRQLPSAKHLDTPTLNDHIPVFLEELAKALESGSDQTIPEALEGSPSVHGMQRYKDGFDIVEVVAEYDMLRGCIHDLAEDNGFNLQGNAFHILNRVFDEAVGTAVQTFATQQALAVQRHREQYLAFVAHDLRTPLSAISLAGRVLEHTLAKRGDSADTARMLRTLHRNVQRLEAIVASILSESDHMHADVGVRLERRAFDLWPLIEALIEDLNPVAGTSSTQLINQIPEDLPVYADASLLKRVFQNLIANAIKYTARGEVLVGARETGATGTVECWVKDNGAGIPQDRLDTIFNKLETDPEKAGGTGLGLPIVKTFVEAHGGTVTVESERGVGSTFRFTLPGSPGGSG